MMRRTRAGPVTGIGLVVSPSATERARIATRSGPWLFAAYLECGQKGQWSMGQSLQSSDLTVALCARAATARAAASETSATVRFIKILLDVETCIVASSAIKREAASGRVRQERSRSEKPGCECKSAGSLPRRGPAGWPGAMGAALTARRFWHREQRGRVPFGLPEGRPTPWTGGWNERTPSAGRRQDWAG